LYRSFFEYMLTIYLKSTRELNTKHHETFNISFELSGPREAAHDLYH